jgi:hypothetical protein
LEGDARTAPAVAFFAGNGGFPVIDDEDLERRVAARAYAIWMEEGRPEGHAEEHWQRAREELAIADNLPAALLPNPRRSDRGHAPGGEPIEEPAVTIENQADLPGLTDQGRNIGVPRYDRTDETDED